MSTKKERLETIGRIIGEESIYNQEQLMNRLNDEGFVVTQATPYVIKAGDAGRLPMISYKAYGTTALWRVIAEYNQIQDPIADVYPGREIMIPDKSQVVTLLTNTKTVAAKSTETASFFI